MSLNSCPIDPVPSETARVARAVFPKGNRYMTMRDELGILYPNDLFADLYPQVGHYGEPPWRLALVTLMQFSENLTDRQAADAVRGRIDWKYALGLELTDTGFDFSVLSEFRTRLIAGAAEERLLTTMLDRFSDRGLLKKRGHQRTDSTHILAAVRSLNRLEIVGETLHAALNALAQVAPTWLRAQVTVEWVLRYGTSFSDYQQPQGKGERQQLAQTIGRDGHHLLTES
jgi:transposase